MEENGRRQHSDEGREVQRKGRGREAKLCVYVHDAWKKIARTQEMLNISARRANDTEHAGPENIKEKQYSEKKNKTKENSGIKKTKRETPHLLGSA